MEKGKAWADWSEMTAISWSYQMLTDEQRKKWEKMQATQWFRDAIHGTYKQRWKVLQAIYMAFWGGHGFMTFFRLHGFTFFDVSGEESNPFANAFARIDYENRNCISPMCREPRVRSARPEPEEVQA